MKKKDKKGPKKNLITKIIITILVTLLISGLIFYAYVNDYYHAELETIEVFSNSLDVKKEILNDNTIIYSNENPTKGLIFYPGGKVEYIAYEPLMMSLASKGILCILIEMPFNLAIFDINAADGFQKQYKEIKNWYIGGHSLGGAMAASYLEKNTNKFDGLILLGAYSTKDLSETKLKVLSIYGTQDKILDKNKYQKYKSNLPKNFNEQIIDGGCHSYFGMYGNQKGDGIPTIKNEEQIQITSNLISNYIYEN